MLDLWWEAGFDPTAADGFVEAFVDALEAHARFLHASRIHLPRFARHRSLATAVRSRLGSNGRIGS